MVKQVIRVPTVLNDGAHRPLQEAVRRANANFDELYGRAVSVKDYGAVGDGVTDDWAAIRAALDSGAVRIYFPATSASYYSTKCFNLKKKYILYGDHGFNDSTNNRSVIKFADNTCGFIIHSSSTNADDYGYNNVKEAITTGADGSVIDSLRIVRGNANPTTIDGVTHGIRMRIRAKISNCDVWGFAGNGIHIRATSGGTNESQGNSNLFLLDNVSCRFNWHGVYANGADVAGGIGFGLNCDSNAGWGIFDSSFLGNTWIGCHTAGNGYGAYKTDDGNQRSVFVGCYEEGDQPPSSIVSQSIHVGGLSNAGNGSAKELSNLCGTRIEKVVNRASINLVTITAAGSGYTSAPTVTFDAPTGASTATATATIGSGFLSGSILKISITAGGAGYPDSPAVTIGGDGSGATATAEISGGIVKSITITPDAEGSGYTTAPITLAAPTQTTATGTAYLNSSGGVAYVVVTNRGSGYTAVPGVTLSGGGGSGATATCTLATDSNCLVTVNNKTANDFTTILEVDRDDCGSLPWRFKEYAYTGDLRWDHGGLDARVPAIFNGARTARKFGRSIPVPYVQSFPLGAWFGTATEGRQIIYASAMPTSGEYARGDFMMNNTISELGSASSKYIILGWSRLVTGTAHVLNTDWLEARCLTGN
jgi:hypothetical protein